MSRTSDAPGGIDRVIVANCLSLLWAAALLIPSSAHAQERGAAQNAMPSDSAVCAAAQTYFKAHPDEPKRAEQAAMQLMQSAEMQQLIQQSMEQALRAQAKGPAKVNVDMDFTTLPDSIRIPLAAAIGKGQFDRAEALMESAVSDSSARLNLKVALKFLATSPDTLRSLFATGVARGHQIQCNIGVGPKSP